MQLLRAFRRRDFAALVLARTISRLGDGIEAVALAWLVLQLTGSATAMGIVLVAQLLPTLALLLLGGAIADRWPKIPLLVASDGLRAMVVGVLAVLIATNSVAMWQFVVLGVLFGMVDAVFMPASAALVPQLVPQEDRPSANALMSLTTRLAGIAGPAAGAVLVAAGGMAVAFAADALSFVVSGALLASLWHARRRSGAATPLAEQTSDDVAEAATSAMARTAPVHPGEEAAVSGWRRLIGDVRAGLAAVVTTPWIGLSIGAATITNITLEGPLGVSVPLLIERSLGGGVEVLGLFQSALAAGSVGAAVLLGTRARLRRRWRLVYGPWVALALAAAAMGLPLGVGGLVASAVVIGCSGAVLGLSWTNALQDLVPEELLGRVYSLDYLGSAALIPVGYLIAGVASDAFGPSVVFLAGGLASAALLAAMTALPQIRALD